jgi:predicted HTH transcriptional regulator
MIPKAFDQIKEHDLQSLVYNGVLEGKTIEYKQELTISLDREKKEFLADVSSFANASGGDLIYGIVEDRDTGAPKSLEGIPIQNEDELIRKLEAQIRYEQTTI